ncbi:argininosuccinate synthase domain-containing protein, partial [Salinispora arenicola]|uniref:argininosuccinate synthase domain-containing protein n=1 Tax=Salinispora arenicola TaxID=168697 RepID=UPI0027DBFFD5
MYRANALYEGQYMMGSSIGRPLIAAAQLRVVEEVGADAGGARATGKGNDQIRFEMTLAALRPDIMVISPWREWDLSSRSDLLAYARQHGIELDLRSGDRPYSIDSNLLHTSYEGEALEDPEQPAPEGLLFRVRDLADTQDEPETVEIHFQKR